jgi:Xaa-Pro aminopeptidase
MSNETIKGRLKALRQLMLREHIDAFIFPSTDPHHGEYVPDHWKGREWISGFDGSAGTAVVTMNEAALWTDSRYFIAAAEQLQGTEFVLMRERVEGTPTVTEWLGQCLAHNTHARVGIDGMVNTAAEVDALKDVFDLVTDVDLLATIWTDRPAIPDAPVVIHPLEYAGEDVSSKLCRIRQALAELQADATLVTTLDDIAWTLNLRGGDVHCNPVFVAYLLITASGATLFVDARKVGDRVRDYLKAYGVETADYDRVGEYLRKMDGETMLLDPNEVNYSLWNAVGCAVKGGSSPIPAMKAVKNEREMEGFRRAMERDGVAMVKFLKWLDGKMDNGEVGELTERSVDRQLTAFRAEQPLFRGISFDTIAGYGAHGAIVHYEATEESDAPLQPRGLLLLDSGAQYLDGTTDITRTIALGPVTEEERRVYTLVLKGHIRLQILKFPDGACGSQLDAVARSPLWEVGLNFLHGTGHGVGAYLNVHEGPHQIRMEWKPAPLHAGMTVTDEPGIYMEGRFGVRIENTLLVTPYTTTEFGSFLQFEPLTLCPIDLRPADLTLLTAEEKAWLNAYHRVVYERLSPLLDEEHQQWLRKVTTQI